MKQLRILFPDQLSHSISSLKHVDKNRDLIFFNESFENSTHVKHHKKKLAFLFSAMRHFAAHLESQGYNIVYSKIGDSDSKKGIADEVERLLLKHKITSITVTHPSEYYLYQEVLGWGEQFGVKVNILPDNRFLCSPEDFKAWAKDRKQLRMEYFYREMRQRHQILIDADGKPIGGKWNYDAENRKTPKHELDVPERYDAKPDQITEEVMADVENHFGDHFGSVEPFYFAVTRKQALAALRKFIEERLVFFGDYQDAMIEGEPWMYHSHLSFYINCGLLFPLECVKAAEEAYHKGNAPLNAVEGFIRQVIGWREYINGIYWLRMPEYKKENYLEAKGDLPEFYWTGDTEMNCVRQCVEQTKAYAYAHHIQRLMVLGNFALLAGVHPDYVNEWFWIVYADAYEWVELPNVSGMTLFADGGYLASKPYAAGGSYINKMSDYCKHCRYKVSKKVGKDACPFNYLYWDFLARNRKKLKNNRRLGVMYKTYDRMGDTKQADIAESSRIFLEGLKP